MKNFVPKVLLMNRSMRQNHYHNDNGNETRRSPGGENGSLLQFSYLEIPGDRGTWQATVHGIAKSQTLLK